MARHTDLPRRDLALRQAAEEGELDHLALLVGERGQGGTDARAPLAVLDELQRRGSGRRSLGGGALGGARRAPAGPHPIERAAARDDDGPGLAAATSGVVGVSPPPQLEEGLLDHVLGLGAISEQVERHRHHPPRAGAVERAQVARRQARGNAGDRQQSQGQRGEKGDLVHG